AGSDIVHEVTGRLGELFEGNMPVNYATARARLTASKTQTWAAYILGSPVAVARELNTPFERGANILVDSSVPLGKGVSSSAAIEIATLRALTAALGIATEGYDLAVLGQIVENQVVGAPCGLMDQLTSALGQAHHFLRIRCQGRDAPSLI